MEYHHHRFEDFSLLFYKKDKLIALLPANRTGTTLHSHQGLSYGGLLLHQHCNFKEHYELFYQLIKYLYGQNISKLCIREIPRIYQKSIAEENHILYFWSKAELLRTDVYSYLAMEQQPQPNRNRQRAIKKALEKHIRIMESDDYDTFWNSILIPNLKQRFGVTPTHTVGEIKQLRQNFPGHIQLFAAYEDKVMKAAAVIFVMDDVAHFQYSSGAKDRAENGALDLLFHRIIEHYAGKKYISFGTSSNKENNTINEGLLYWKESYGAQHTVQRFYTIKTENHIYLKEQFR